MKIFLSRIFQEGILLSDDAERPAPIISIFLIRLFVVVANV
jgi:hypothetical protein